MTTRHNKNEFVTQVAFDEHVYKVGRKFDELTDIMIGEFDKVYDRMDRIEEKVNLLINRFNNFEPKLDLIIKHLDIKAG